jgi:hypothetical protein
VLNEDSLKEMWRVQNADNALDFGLKVGLGWMLSGVDIPGAGLVASHGGTLLDSHSLMILETSVGRARVCGFRVDWQGETTRGVVSRKEEQRSQAARKPCNRARSGVTQSVSVIEGANASIQAVSQGLRSGQLRFLG